MKLIVLILALLVGVAHAQEIPVTLEASASSNIAPANITLTWSAPGAETCTASGGWSGAKAPSGTQVIQNVRSPGASYGLACESEGESTGSALLSWTPPTHNTDETPYTNPRGYFVHYGPSPDMLHETIPLFVPTATAYEIDELAPSEYHFCIRAVSLSDIQSDCSNIVSKNVTGTPGASGNASAQVALETRPNPPGAAAVQ